MPSQDNRSEPNTGDQDPAEVDSPQGAPLSAEERAGLGSLVKAMTSPEPADVIDAAVVAEMSFEFDSAIRFLLPVLRNRIEIISVEPAKQDPLCLQFKCHIMRQLLHKGDLDRGLDLSADIEQELPGLIQVNPADALKVGILLTESLLIADQAKVALEVGNQVADAAKELDFPLERAMLHCTLANAQLADDAPEAAEASIFTARSLLTSLSGEVAKTESAWAKLLHAQVYLERGQPALALPLVEAAAATFGAWETSSGDLWEVHSDIRRSTAYYVTHARCLLCLERFPEAESLLERGIAAVVENIEMADALFRLRMAQAEVAHSQADLQGELNILSTAAAELIKSVPKHPRASLLAAQARVSMISTRTIREILETVEYRDRIRELTGAPPASDDRPERLCPPTELSQAIAKLAGLTMQEARLKVAALGEAFILKTDALFAAAEENLVRTAPGHVNQLCRLCLLHIDFLQSVQAEHLIQGILDRVKDISVVSDALRLALRGPDDGIKS
ncbi:MAG: hypothetical protein K1X79_07970 [Oligoflexia bacterium]|nr:hypothetical protein [Oligoflexia bacterium]